MYILLKYTGVLLFPVIMYYVFCKMKNKPVFWKLAWFLLGIQCLLVSFIFINNLTLENWNFFVLTGKIIVLLTIITFFVGGYQSIQLENDMEKKNSSLKSLIIGLIATVLLIILIWVG